jgi:hypothetical protein
MSANLFKTECFGTPVAKKEILIERGEQWQIRFIG